MSQHLAAATEDVFTSIAFVAGVPVADVYRDFDGYNDLQMRCIGKELMRGVPYAVLRQMTLPPPAIMVMEEELFNVVAEQPKQKPAARNHATIAPPKRLRKRTQAKRRRR